MKVDLAILFWFYKDLKVTTNHLQLLKKNNPGTKIFGLYGGAPSEAKRFRDTLGPMLNEFYQSPFRDSEWKWKNGDLVILDWYKNAGKRLSWDSVIVIQWDMLVLGPINKWFPKLKKDQLFITGLCTLNKRTEIAWNWTTPLRKLRRTFIAFKKELEERSNYSGDIMAGLFILEIFPRIFLEKYRTVKNPEVGFLEYKVPTYAKIFGISFYECDLGTYWGNWFHFLGNYPLIALPIEIKTSYVQKQMKKPQGWRLFHPYYKLWTETEDCFAS